MLKKEQNYDFRKTICRPHKRVYVKANDAPRVNEFALKDGITVAVESADTVAALAARDFVSYLKTAFGIKASLTDGAATVTARVVTDGLGENANGYMGRKITVDENGVLVEAFDMRGIAQAFYELEELMNTRKAPYLAYGTVEHRPAFSPRMIHSGYGMDEYPDEYLSVCAHHGYDAILVFVKDKDHSAHGECDFNDIITRAAKYGIDVYAYSYLKNFTHPCDEGAKEHYGELYGGIFRDIKGLKGMIFVGESIEFPSRDPRVACRHYYETPENGIHDGKITPGWFPCSDYPEWLSLVRDSIRAESPDADVVFWTYNFGFVDAKDRVELLRKLPTDISLLVTFEMFEKYPMGNGIGQVCDYTISYVGPGQYFLSEAEVAKERGIRLYSQVNTGGRTWDFGVLPYEPFPNQWNARHEKLLESREKYGLSGLMESHHFGFLPSFISRITQNNYTLGGIPYEEKLRIIAEEYAGADYQKFIDAMAHISESIQHYVASDENQYGAYRIGPAFPFCLIKQCKLPNKPGVHFGNGIYEVTYRNMDGWGSHDPYGLRIRGEIASEKTARECIRRGLRILRTVKNKTVELERLINLVHFIEKCYTTAINAHNFYIERNNLVNADTKAKITKAIAAIEKIAKAEIENVKSTVPIVERDSSIGYEASMGYQCDRAALEWKLEQMNYMLDKELNLYRRAVDPEAVKGRYFKF